MAGILRGYGDSQSLGHSNVKRQARSGCILFRHLVRTSFNGQHLRVSLGQHLGFRVHASIINDDTRIVKGYRHEF